MTKRFEDWVRAPNIGKYPDVYELENEAIARDGRLDAALLAEADWTDRSVLDIGCGTGFWLPHYARTARSVVGIEPDPALLEAALARVANVANAAVLAGSAESIPLPDASVDVIHARFAYFFGPGAEPGLREVERVLRPGGVFIAVDNGWHDDDFGRLLRLATAGNAAIDPRRTEQWWLARGAKRRDVEGGWACSDRAELETVLRIEFASEVVDAFLEDFAVTGTISYGFALYVWRSA